MSGALLRRLPEGRAGQALCLAITALGLAIAWFGLIAPVLQLYAEGQAQQAAQSAMLAHMQSVAAELPRLRKLAERVQGNRSSDTATTLLSGDTDAIAAANLQKVIQDLAANAGLVPTSIEVLSATQRGAFRRIGLQIETTASWPTLMALLRAMNDSALGLIVDDLTLHAIATSDTGRDTTHPMLDASFMVFALRPDSPHTPSGLTRAALTTDQTD
ncbi:type II secretion system protein GspM [Acidisoma sp. 7E03]